MRTTGRFSSVFAFAFVLLATTLVRADEWEFPQDWFWHSDDAQRAKHEKILGKPAPALDLSEWRNKTLTVKDMKGKILVIDFWATWCGPCIKSIPHNNEMYAKYKDQGVEIIGICSSDRGQEKYDSAVKQHGIEYPSARDRAVKSGKAWAVMWYPTYAVVDRKGIVRAIGLKPNNVDKVIDKLLAEDSGGESASDSKPTKTASTSGDSQTATIDPSWFEGDEKHRAKMGKLQGKAPPKLIVNTWTNSKPLKEADLKGKVVMLDFWATWCGPCIASIPHTNELMEKYGEQGLVIIGVCNSKGAETMSQTVNKEGIKYPVAADVNGKTVEAYGVNGYPDYYFIDRAGNLRIADCKNGSVDDAIKALLAEPAPEKTASAK